MTVSLARLMDGGFSIGIEAPLRQALADGHMRLYYQPQIDIATGRLTSAEALLRWLDPVEGLP